MSRYLDGTNDVAFKKLFSDKGKLIDLLNALLKLSEGNRIVDLTYITTEQLPLFLDGKRSLFDLKVTDESGKWYIIEMQRRMEKDYLNRAQLYGCYTYVNQIMEGTKHKNLLPVIIISIIGTKAFGSKIPYISYHQLQESTTREQHLFSLTYVFIELGKLKKTDLKNNTDEWLHMLKYAPEEQEPPQEIKNKTVLSAYESLEQFRWTPQEHDAYFRAQMAMEQEEDKFEEKYNQGKAEGKAEGEAKGKAEGKAERNIEIAKNLLRKNIDINIIVDSTDLTAEEIRRLKAEIEKDGKRE